MLRTDWARELSRVEQRAPPGDWRIWLLLAGRGFGKTRAGAEWLREQVETARAGRVALVAPTAADARDVMIEGESGLLRIAPERNRPTYEPSKRRLTWPNGAIATAYSAEEPDRLRGPQHDAAWCDEIAAWRHEASWDMLMFGLRLGADPRCVVTTTPRPGRLLRMLVKDPHVAVTRGSTFDNREHLAPAFLDAIVKRYHGTRLGRQELLAELLEDAPGALWSRDAIERGGIAVAPALSRIVVAIDPAVTSGAESDETGIIVAGSDDNGHGYVLDDLSGRFAPHEWARRAIAAYHGHHADRIVAEINNGGEMVEATLRVIDPHASYRAVHASRGKAMRAEPVAALYEQGRIHHVGRLPQLEDQMCNFTGVAERAGRPSPDRVDALVWAITDLMIAQSGTGILDYYRALYREGQ
jgi:phage terminase large subunit-like protein